MRKKMWRCKSCGRVCDSSNSVCPDCGLDLGFYGEIQFIETGDPDPSPSSVSQPQEQAQPAVEEERKPEIKEERKAKENKPKKKKSKRGKALVAVGMVLLVLLGLGCIMSMRKVNEVYFGVAWDWEHNGAYDDYYAESDSSTTQTVIVEYTGVWGSLTELTVTSSNSSVVKVVSVEEDVDKSDSSNQISAIRLEAGNPGTAEITAKVGNKSESYLIHVYQITGVELEGPEILEVADGIVLGLEDSIDFTARLKYTYAGEVQSEQYLPKVELSSSDTNIVEIDSSSGKLTARGYGTAEIIASAGNYKTSIPVNVFDVTKIELNCYDLLVDGNGKTISWIPEGLTMECAINYYYKGPDIYDFPYTLESSNEEVLFVDPVNFTITAVGPGEATITAAMGGFSDSMTLEVYPVDRSTGAWVKGSIQSIAAPEEGGSRKIDYTTTISFGEGISTMAVPTYFGAGGAYTQLTGWEVLNEQFPDEPYSIQACEGNINLQGSQWEQSRSIAGITFLFKKASSEYNPATDLLDYWVIYTE